MQPMLQCADGSSPTITTRIGAAGITNMISPSNLSDENVEAFVNTFKINYLYSSNEEVVDCFSEKLSLAETEIEYLYRIVNP